MVKKLKNLGKSLEKAVKNNAEIIKLAKTAASSITEKVAAENGRFQAWLDRLADKAQAAAAAESQAGSTGEEVVALMVADVDAQDLQDLQDDALVGLSQEMEAMQAECPLCDDGGPQMPAAEPVCVVGSSQSELHSYA